MIVNWTEPALESLDAIFNHLRQEAPYYAQQLIEELMSSVDRLEQFPESGRRVPEAKDVEVREIIARGYRIFYIRVNDMRVDILGVKNSRQDLTLQVNQPWESH